MLSLSTLLLLSLLWPGGLTYYVYQKAIPNGGLVPHPCKANYMWHGVGHDNPKGGGPRNPFGQAFAQAGHQWTPELCQTDSDGDGLTNGEELGDPSCSWTAGNAPNITSGITHPGVCTPVEDPKCQGKNDWLDCSVGGPFECDPINEPDVMNITLRFPPTKVPAKETTYICFNFELPSDQEYHLIAVEPFIDNHNVMHHMGLSGCSDSVTLLSEPQECLMGAEGCTAGLGIWTLGMTGQCYTPEAGFRFGKGAYTMAAIQHHWTNPEEVDTWYDSSGFTLYYTPKLRKYNAQILTLGQTHLMIPPGQNSWVHQGTCTSRCTQKMLKGNLHVFGLLNHMHYLGTRQNVTLERPGNAPEVMADDNPYGYDSPVEHKYPDPVIIRPGDELKTYCTFQSRSNDRTTRYGEGSFDEMCFSLLLYYPAENFEIPMCAQWKDVDLCDVQEVCDFGAIFNSSHPSTAATIKKVLDSCDPAGTCQQECPAVVEEVAAANRCIGDLWDYLHSLYYTFAFDPVLLKFTSAMQSCGWPERRETTRAPVTSPAPYEPVSPGANPGSMLVNLVKQLDTRPLLQNIIMNVNYNYGTSQNNDNQHADTWH